MPGVLKEIDKTIKEREKTDRIMSFAIYFAISIIILVIYMAASLLESASSMIIVLSLYIIFVTYVMYLLIKREEHLKRERQLLKNLILFFEGKIDESKISPLRHELRERESEEEEKNPIIWALLSLIPFAALYVYYFLMIDFYRHDKREAYTLQFVNKAMEDSGAEFVIPKKPQNQEIPKRNFILFLVLTVVTFGLFGIYWFYILIRDPNAHFEYQKEWENRLLEPLRSPGFIQSQEKETSVQPAEDREGTRVFEDNRTRISPGATQILAEAELILPRRTIKITSDQNAFGRSDFEKDLPSEKIGYISNKTGDRYHFMITRQDDAFYIQDDFSLNGTNLNGREIKGEGKRDLKNGDKIILAGIDDFAITFKMK